MGYESRIYVVNVSEFKNRVSPDVPPMKWAQIIAMVNMSCMDGGFHKLFDTPIDYKIFATSENDDTDTDKYGAHMNSAKLEAVITWLDNEINNKKETYRRLMPLLGLLRGIEPEKWDDIQVVHFGY